MGLGLTYDDKIAVLDLGDTENRFSPDVLDEIDVRLDEVAGTLGAIKQTMFGLAAQALTASSQGRQSN